MSYPRLVPYVDIPYNPVARRALKRSAERNHAPTSLSTIPSSNDNISPRKRRKLPDNQDESNLSTDLDLVNLGPQPSPTASEFGLLNSDSDPIPPDTRSPSVPYDGTNRSKSTSKDSSRSNLARPLEEFSFHIYDVTEDDVTEDQDLVIFGESLPEEEDKEIPVRILNDFAIYSEDTGQLVYIAELLQLDYAPQKYRASGLVRPWVDLESDGSDIEDDFDEENDKNEAGQDQFIRYLEFNVHAESESQYRIDPKVYIRTEFSWYILETPSKVYCTFFVPFWLQHRFLHLLVVASLDDARVTYQEFIKNLSAIDKKVEFIVASEVILGRGLEAEDLESDEVLTYVLSNLRDICEDAGIKISRVPLIREIMGATHYEFDTIPGTKSSSGSKPPSHMHKPNKIKLSGPAKSRKQGRTFLTTIVNRIAKEFFDGSLEVVESALNFPDDDTNSDILAAQHKSHYSDPEQIIWGKQLGKYKGFYKSAMVDGVLYSIGDVVMVAPDTKDTSAPYSVNKYANRWWYFFEPPNGTMKMFHGLWFSHGSKTLLQETSHSKALYLLGTCDNNPVTTIFKKCNFRIMQPGDDEVVDDGSHVSNDFHCGLFYDTNDASFTDIPTTALEIDVEHKSCFACDLQDNHTKKMETKHSNDNTLNFNGMIYHIHDYVYIIPSGDTKLLDIGQIISIDQLKVHVHLLGRYDDYVHQQRKASINDSRLIFDEKRLFLTKERKAVPLYRLDGICYVKYLRHACKIEKWVQIDDHYYLCQKGDVYQLDVMSEEDFSYCEPCYLEEQQRRRVAENFSQTNSKLIGLELFSGAGGLGIGMDLSGFVETKYAIEFSPSAAKTYIFSRLSRKNHPETTVYCQDSSVLLKHAVMASNNKGKAPALLSLDGKTYCPALPAKNAQIDFIFGGPPCQSFSLANHSKRRDDIRTTMSCNMLSYVEHYNPTYFLLENVFGFLAHRFYSNHQTKSGAVIETEIQMGMAKFVVRTLIALGYQVRFKVLQAAQYGVPQGRRRVIFWGAKCGVPLPSFPVPMYAYDKGMHKVNLPTGDTLEPETRSKDPEVYHQYAPLRPVTVDAAIGDLPKINPHHIISSTKQTRLEDKHRRNALGIPSFPASFGEDKKNILWDALPGFPNGAAYFVQAQNRFQKWVRRDMRDENGEEAEVSGQYTTKFNGRVIEATCTVHLEPGACHKDLPQSLLPAYAMKKKKRVFYGRMDGDGFFKCIVTQLSPLLKNQWPLHPSQKRIITVRECARCQGFPDNYVFESVEDRPAKIIEDQLKQIGNAVAVPFALALGKELGKAMILAWEKKQREGSVLL
ncbi:C5-DNA-methyltransferase [Pholiota molesta]|nr:C5-DNA-methyltransferase [Pholiota molesta]